MTWYKVHNAFEVERLHELGLIEDCPIIGSTFPFIISSIGSICISEFPIEYEYTPVSIRHNTYREILDAGYKVHCQGSWAVKENGMYLYKTECNVTMSLAGFLNWSNVKDKPLDFELFPGIEIRDEREAISLDTPFILPPTAYIPTQQNDFDLLAVFTPTRPVTIDLSQSSSEETMELFYPITVGDLHRMGVRRGVARIRYKNKVRSLEGLFLKHDSKYKMRTRMTNALEFIVESSDIIEIDLFRTQFDANLCTLPFRYNDWAAGHHAVRINKSYFMDNLRGIRSYEYVGDWVYLWTPEVDEMRRHNNQSKIDRFLADPFENITCGFELETEATEGYNYENTISNLIDESLDSQVNDIMDAGVFEYPCAFDWGTREFRNAAKHPTRFRNWLKEQGISSWNDAMEVGAVSLRELDCYSEQLADNLRDEIDVDLSDHFNVPNLEVIDDESVKGFEFITKGGLTPAKFADEVKNVFTLRHSTSTRCGFHIHLKVKDINSKYNVPLRQHLTKYILDNADRLPDGVIERWADDNANYFFRPDDDKRKFNFINFHGEYKTLEFRCFGNIQTADEAMTCFELAVESLIDYYKQQPTYSVPSGEWSDKVMECWEDPIKRKALVKGHNRYIKDVENQSAKLTEIMKSLPPSINFVVGE